MNTDDYLRCDCPLQDHVPLRYAWRCWWRHRVEVLREKAIRKIDRALERIWWQM